MIVRTLTLVRKEFLHIVRDRRTLVVMLVMPAIQLVLMGYAATTDVERLSTVVFDSDKSPGSRELLDAYRASDYFELNHFVDSEQAVRHLVDAGEARAGLIIPVGYGEDVTAGGQAQVAFVIDGSDPGVATTVYAASQSVGQSHSMRILQRTTGMDPNDMPGVQVRPRVWYSMVTVLGG